MEFVQFCGILERIASASQRADKVRVLEQLWISLRQLATDGTANDAAAAKNEPILSDLPSAATSSSHGDVFFAYMRLLLPQLDTMRSTYSLKESKIAKMYVELLGLPHTSPDAIRFLHWKDPSKNHIQATAFSDVVFIVLGRRGHTGSGGIASASDADGDDTVSSSPQRMGRLSVADVNQCLDRLCTATTSADRKNALMHLLRRCSPLEHKWLIRIIVKDMRMHMMHQSILSAFHPNAMELYNNTNDLAYVCKKCTEPSELCVEGDRKQGIFLFQPLKPMLASIVTSAKLAALLQTESLLVEPKFDGERMMIHASCDGKIQYWTRNAKNYTALYGPKFNDTIMASIFHRRASEGASSSGLIGVTNIILDGEFLLYDSVARTYKEFGSNRTFALSNPMGGDRAELGAIHSPQNAAAGVPSVGNENEDDGALWFCYQVFDVVFLNGESLLLQPLDKRKALLASVVQPLPTRIDLTPTTPIRTIADVLMQLDKALTEHHEGIMIKVRASHYVPGERRSKWLKLKPDHVSGLADTLDLVILGGYYGTKYGMRHISHFLLGVWKNESSPTPSSPTAKFLTFCKVGTGYSEQELRDLQTQLDSKWIPLPHGSVPEWLDGWKPGAGEVPDVYITPGDSVVLEIFGYSFTATTKFSFGQTLRFPRCHRIRADKGVADATDLSQLVQIIDSSKDNFAKKLAALQANNGSAAADATLLMVQAAKRARKEEVKMELLAAATLTRTIACIPTTITVPSRHSVQPESTFLDGYEVCVLFTNPVLHPRQDLERRVLANGGAVVANPQPKTSLIVASSVRSQKVCNWIDMCNKRPEVMQKFFSTSVISIDWLLGCIAAKQVMPLAPRHMIYTSPQLHELFRRTLDPYQDSFYDPCDRASLLDSIRLASACVGADQGRNMVVTQLDPPTSCNPTTKVCIHDGRTLPQIEPPTPVHRTTSQCATLPDASQLQELSAASERLQHTKSRVLSILDEEVKEHPTLSVLASGAVPTAQALLQSSVGLTYGPVNGVFRVVKSEDEGRGEIGGIDVAYLFSHLSPQVPSSWRCYDQATPLTFGEERRGTTKRQREDVPIGVAGETSNVGADSSAIDVHSRAQFLMTVELLSRGRQVSRPPRDPIGLRGFRGIDVHGVVEHE